MTGAVIGTGYMGKTHAAILRKLVDTLVICSLDEKAGQALAEEFDAVFYKDFDQMLEEMLPDFITVCVPTYLHYGMVKKALEKGVPTLCEKPFTLEQEDALELLRLSKKTGTLLMVAHCLRFSQPYAFLKQCIADRRFGALQSLHMYRNSAKPDWSVGGWFSRPECSGGIIRDLHIHDTDMAVCLLGVPDAVYTSANEVGCTTTFAYPNALRVTADASWRNASGYAFSAGFDAVFENGCLTCENGQLRLHTDQTTELMLTMGDYPAELESADMMENELRFFCQCVKENVPPHLCRVEESVQTMFVSCAQSRSARHKAEEKVAVPAECL